MFRNGHQVGSVQQYDNRLLQFLLRAHRPEIYGGKRFPAAADAAGAEPLSRWATLTGAEIGVVDHLRQLTT